MRLPALIFVALLFIAAPANSDVQASQRAEAARANNLGTALMNQQLLDKAAAKLALSSLTMPHELARVVLAEQIYRAFTILAGHPYSK